MIRNTFLLLFLMSFQSAVDFFKLPTEEFLSKEIVHQSFDLNQTDYELMDATVFHLLNQKRTALGLPLLKHHTSLYQAGRKIQSEFEFRPFVQEDKTNARIRKSIEKDRWSLGFEGQLSTAFALQIDGLNWNSEQLFHYDEASPSHTGFHLFEGKSSSKEKIELPTYTYLECAKSIVNALSKEAQEAILSNIYEDCGIHVMWYYKTLNRRKIPQVKAVIILGGYATKGIK